MKRSRKATSRLLRLTVTKDGRLLSKEGTPVDGQAIDILLAQGVLSKDAIVLIDAQDPAAADRAAEFNQLFSDRGLRNVLIQMDWLVAGKATARSHRSTKSLKALRVLLDDLDAASVGHYESGDTMVRDCRYLAVYHGFIVQTAGYVLPNEFGMYSPEGNAGNKTALAKFIKAATAEARKLGFDTPEARFEAFQDGRVTSKGGSSYDDYFGSADSYEAYKRAIGKQ